MEVAKEMFQKSVSIRKQTLQESHFEIANTYMHLGDVLRRLGEQEEANTAFTKAMNIRTLCFGKDHPLAIEAGEKCTNIEKNVNNS